MSVTKSSPYTFTQDHGEGHSSSISYAVSSVLLYSSSLNIYSNNAQFTTKLNTGKTLLSDRQQLVTNKTSIKNKYDILIEQMDTLIDNKSKLEIVNNK